MTRIKGTLPAKRVIALASAAVAALALLIASTGPHGKQAVHRGGHRAQAGTASGRASRSSQPVKPPGCFSAPGACGYPDPHYRNVGVPGGLVLTPSGPITVTTPGLIITGLDITADGQPGITVEAPNVTIENTRITETGGGCGARNTCGNTDVYLYHGALGTVISHVELTTDSGTTVEHAIRNLADPKLEVDHVYNHGPDALMWTASNATVSDSYSRIGLRISNDHLENVYCPGGQTISLHHNTLENTAGQVAASIFCDTNGGSGGTCSSHLSVTNNLLAGGGFDIYECGNASAQGSASLIFTGNDIARCTTPPIVQNNEGGWSCNGSQGNVDDAVGGGSADAKGFFPFGGHYGTDSYTYCSGNRSVWSGNYYDDNGTAVSC